MDPLERKLSIAMADKKAFEARGSCQICSTEFLIDSAIEEVRQKQDTLFSITDLLISLREEVEREEKAAEEALEEDIKETNVMDDDEDFHEENSGLEPKIEPLQIQASVLSINEDSFLKRLSQIREILKKRLKLAFRKQVLAFKAKQEMKASRPFVDLEGQKVKLEEDLKRLKQEGAMICEVYGRTHVTSLGSRATNDRRRDNFLGHHSTLVVVETRVIQYKCEEKDYRTF